MVNVSPWAVRASRSSRELKPRPQMPVDSTETMAHYSNLLFTSRTTTTTTTPHSPEQSIVTRPCIGREPEAPLTPDKPRSSMRVKQKIKRKTKKKKIKHKTSQGIYKRPIPMVISWARCAARSDCDRRPMKQSSDLLLSSPTDPQSPDGSTITVLQEEMLEKLYIEQSGEEHQGLINSEIYLTAHSQAQAFIYEGDGAPTFEETSEKSKIEVNKLRPTKAYQDFIISKAYLIAKAQVAMIHEGDGASVFEKALPIEEHQAIKELEAHVTYEWVSVGASVYEETPESKIGYNELRSTEEQQASKQTETCVTQAQVQDEYLITSTPSVEESPEKPNCMIREPRPTKEHASMTPQARPEVFHEGTTNQVFEEMLEKCNTEFNGLRVSDEHEGARMYYNFDGSSQNGVYKGDQVGGIYMTSRAQHDALHEGNTTSAIEEPGQKSNIELGRLRVTHEHQGVEVSGTRNYYKSSEHGGCKSNEEEDKQGNQMNKRTLQKIKKKKIRPKIKDFTNGSQTPRQPKNKENTGPKRHYTRKNKNPNPDLKDAVGFSPDAANEEFETLRQAKQKDNKGPTRRYTRKNKGWNPNSEDAPNVTKVESDATNASWKEVDRQSPTVKRRLNFDLEDRPVGVGTGSDSTRPYIQSSLDHNKLVAEDSDVRYSPSRRESVQKVRHTFRVKAFLRSVNLSLGGEAMDLVTKGNFTSPCTKLTLKPNKLAVKHSVAFRPLRRESLKKRLSLSAVRNQIYQDLVDSSCRSYVTSNPSCVTLYKDFYGQFVKVDKNERRKRKRMENLKACGSCELPACDGQISHAIVPYIKPIYDNMKYQNMIMNAIVPFVGGGMLVPFSSKKSRVKVDLDPETEREWKLLMGKKAKDESGVGDTKYWEEERMLLHNRIIAFIAQVTHIQGDRRFSRWGGSVVDSVVGVFLTQNVSDYLSSSAFMAIVARFPARSKVKSAKSDFEKRSTSTEYVKESNSANNYTAKRKETTQVTDCDQDFAVTNKAENSTMKEIPGSFTSLGSTTKGDNIEVSEERVGSILNHPHTSHRSHNSKATILGQTEEVTDTDKVCIPEKVLHNMPGKASTTKRSKKQTEESRDWDILRKDVLCGLEGESSSEAPDIVDWEAVRSAGQKVLAQIIQDRGMQNQLGGRILDFLNRTKNNHGSINLEWLRKVSPDKAKEYLLDIFGVGLKSTECIRLLSLEMVAFPVDTNVGRICVRLGWVPLRIDPGLPESTQIHLLEQYPLMDGIQKYLWTRLCTLDKSTLYEIHYQLITFGKVFCTKVKPNCNACPMKGSCKHYASASSSARLLIQGPEKKNSGTSSVSDATSIDDSLALTVITSNDGFNPVPQSLFMSSETIHAQSEPIIEFPESPKHVCSERPDQVFSESLVDNEDEKFESSEDFGDTGDIEDYYEFIDLTKTDTQKFWDGVKESGLEVNYDEFSKANSVPTITSKTRKLKETIDLRTEHEVYEIPDGHFLLEGMDPRVPNDPCPYLLSIWSPGENAEIVKATFLIPCRTANRGAFPLNGTYFQTNEVFADDASSVNPIDVQMALIQNFPRRTLYVGSSTYAIFRGMASADEVGLCFQRGNICLRGFDRETRRPMRLTGRLHSKLHKGIKSKKPDNVRGGKGNQKRN